MLGTYSNSKVRAAVNMLADLVSLIAGETCDLRAERDKFHKFQAIYNGMCVM